MTEYTIREEGGCTFVFGDGLPIDALAALTNGKSTKGKIMATHLARLAGAIFAWGKPQMVASQQALFTVRADWIPPFGKGQEHAG